MQGIYTYIPETNYVPREYSVAAILLLLFMMLISLVSVLNLLYFTLVLSEVCFQCPIWLFSGVPWLIIIIISTNISISVILALQSWLNLSLFQNCPPLFSLLLLTPPVPHVLVLQIFHNWFKLPQLRFYYTSSAFWFKQSELSTWIQFLHPKKCPSHLSLPIFITLSVSGSS